MKNGIEAGHTTATTPYNGDAKKVEVVVTATVNYATESAHIELDSDIPVADLVRVVEQTGYAAAAASTCFVTVTVIAADSQGK